MWRRLDALLRRKSAADETITDRLLALERDVQSLRLEVEERDQKIATLRHEVERQRNGESTRISQAVQIQIEQMLTDVAAPIAQLLTQAHLVEVEGKPVPTKDVLAVARRFVRALENHGLTLEGSVGETVPFDPNYHEPLTNAPAFSVRQEVVIRFVGAAYRGKILRKAAVTEVVR